MIATCLHEDGLGAMHAVQVPKVVHVHLRANKAESVGRSDEEERNKNCGGSEGSEGERSIRAETKCGKRASPETPPFLKLASYIRYTRSNNV